MIITLLIKTMVLRYNGLEFIGTGRWLTVVLCVVQAAEHSCWAAMLSLHLSPCQFPVARKCGGGGREPGLELS